MPAQHSQKVSLQRETTPPGTYATVGEVVELTGPDGAAAVLDVTNLQSSFVEKLPGLPDPGSWAITLNQDLNSAEQTAMREEWGDSTVTAHNYRVTYPDPTNLTNALLTRSFAGKVQSWSATAAQNTQITIAASILVLGTIVDTTP